MLLINTTPLYPPASLISRAAAIANESYQPNSRYNPTKRRVTGAEGAEEQAFVDYLTALIATRNKTELPVEMVMFACSKGTDGHRDQLDNSYGDKTWIVPLVVPAEPGVATMWSQPDGQIEQGVDLAVGGLYEFTHGDLHGVNVSNAPQPCVLMMIATKVA
jgi:hypothetical protein